jgi:hypothetical protein
MDALRTHPVVIVGGLVQENPFFVPPDQFLLEIRERRAGSQERRHGELMADMRMLEATGRGPTRGGSS